MDYEEAGVNIAEGYRAVEKYRDIAAGTLSPSGLGSSVLNSIGSFAGLFSLKEPAGNMEDPVLVSGTDGVGTKLEIAFRLKKYDTVGIDCTAMCINDILCHGARPLFFLDYIACGKLDASVAAELVKGIAYGCKEAGCVLLGGETAEMPGFYEEGKYDIAGFAAGIVDRKNIIDGNAIREGDILIGITSSGPHSSGFSLIRKVLPDLTEEFCGMSLGQTLLEPTRIYVKPVLGLLEKVPLHGMAHITGGGFYENIPRMFKAPEKNLDAIITNNSWPIPAIFNRITAGVAELSETGTEAVKAGTELLNTNNALCRMMFNTFNMGIGFVIALDKEDVQRTKEYLDNCGFPSWEIGRIASRNGGYGKPGLYFE
ncbi:MAG: phosphoribosylformylglycinamidine cyclo-ligase [Treponema sp.]|jgi:phosphoribosylformylglycinamidine cyclo-ligase|nr:phosphoribosylformylglycinamidine cyclo-ligase [Treponema sp.]